MSTCIQKFNRASIPINIILTTVAVASAVVAAVALAVICSLIAPPLLLFPGAYSIIAIVSGSISLLLITALVIKAILGTNQTIISGDSEDSEELGDIEGLEDFTVGSKKPRNVFSHDWDILSKLDLSAEKNEAILTEKNTGIAQKYIKISRRAHNGLIYSYLLHKSGKIYRCTHKTARQGEPTEEKIGSGGFKTAYQCYDHNNKPTLVRAVVNDETEFQETCQGFFEAYKQYPDDPDLITGVPHTYYSLKHKCQRRVFYSPKMICLSKLNFATLTEQQSIEIFQQILRLIAKIHQDGGAHKDIKTDNIFIEDDAHGEIKVALMDFDMYTRKDQNGDCGTKVMMPDAFIGRSDLTLKDCQEGDVYAAAFIAICLFGGKDLYRAILKARGNGKTPLNMNDVRTKFQEVSQSRPFFGQISPLILQILERKKDAYRTALGVLSEFNRTALAAGSV